MTGTLIVIRDTRGPAYDIYVTAVPHDGHPALSDIDAVRLVNAEVAALKAAHPGGHPVDLLVRKLSGLGIVPVHADTVHGF